MIRKITPIAIILLGVIIFLTAIVVTFYIFNSAKEVSIPSIDKNTSSLFVSNNDTIVTLKKANFKDKLTSSVTTKYSSSALVDAKIIPFSSADGISSFDSSNVTRIINDDFKVPIENTISLSEEPKKSIKKTTPKLAIIMDDVSFRHHVKELKNIKYPITPSFFPSSDRYPDTPALAKKFSHYMIHMPMEAFRYIAPEDSTLLVSDKNSVLEQKISKVIEDFPTAIAINNHTGSKFTADSDAMNRLFSILQKYHMHFIDSRTSAKTKSVEIGAIYNSRVLERNIFLDNKADVSYIQKQLKKAVLYAKKHGQAIAICHPRETTFEALNNSKEIFKGVELVYIDECYD